MRHKIKRFTLGNRFTSFKKATLRDVAKSVLLHQRIKTTKLKAKAAKPLVDRLISLGKDGALSSKRRAFSILCDHNLVSLLFTDIAPLFKDRSGGYTRIIPWKNRRGDNAELVILELTEKKAEEKVKTAKASKESKKEEPKEAAEPKEHIAAPAPPQKKEPVVKKKEGQKKFFAGLRKFFKKEGDSL